jgi:hypothetical protein
MRNKKRKNEKKKERKDICMRKNMIMCKNKIK